MADEKATLNFDISKDLSDLLEAEVKRLQISKADFCRIRLVEYFEKKGGDNATISSPASAQR